jgi:hypothetical protein
MRYVAVLVAIVVFIATAATADARLLSESQRKAKRGGVLHREESRPRKPKYQGLRRRTERSLEEDFRTGIGDNRGRRRGALGEDEEE